MASLIFVFFFIAKATNLYCYDVMCDVTIEVVFGFTAVTDLYTLATK